MIMHGKLLKNDPLAMSHCRNFKLIHMKSLLANFLLRIIQMRALTQLLVNPFSQPTILAHS